MGYDVTNNDSVIELVAGTQLPVPNDLIPIVLPSTLPSPELVEQEVIQPVGSIVALPDIVPSPELVGMDTITPVGDVIELPLTVPPDGIVLLETIEIPQSLQNTGRVIEKFEDLTDVDITNRTDGSFVQYNDVTKKYEHVPSPVSGTLTSDIPVVLADGKTLGKYVNGQTIPAIGKTLEEVLRDIALEYVYPEFSSFSVSGQVTMVEIGTTLSGTRTFSWSIVPNSGTVNVVNILDQTLDSYLITNTPNDGSETVAINSSHLNTNGATQSYLIRAYDVTPDPDYLIESDMFTITARYYRFFGPAAGSPTNSSEVRGLPVSEFQVSNDQFILDTGNTLVKFVVALPPDRSISEVIDLDALNANITDEYVQTTTITVNDAGGTGRIYNIFEMNIGVPYTNSHRHRISTS